MLAIVDSAIPYLKGILEPHFVVEYLPSHAITTEKCRNADVLLIRTRTLCNATLLEGSSIQFIGTATIGTDHIDLEYCHQHQITVVNAPGCNAWAVVQWVVSILIQIRRYAAAEVLDRPIGIVGCGAIGGRLAKLLEIFHIETLLCDPYLEETAPFSYTGLARIAHECSIITIHTPLTTTGRYPTYHLLDHSFFSSLKRHPYILHAARGGIVDDFALFEAHLHHKVAAYYLDVYEEENDEIPYAIIEDAKIATPHIAGYSIEGKLAATQTIVNKLSDFFSVPLATPQLPDEKHPFIIGQSLDELAKTYDIEHDSQSLKKAPQQLEKLRTEYKLRHDLRFYQFGKKQLEDLIHNQSF